MITNEMASLIREADVKLLLDDGVWVIANLDKFAELVAAAEREACAKMCENKALEVSSGLHSQAQNDYFDGYYFARAIRTRGI